MNNFFVGFGWLTIKFREVNAQKLANHKRCEFGSSCDPFIRLSFDGKPIFETPSQTNTETYEVNVTYTSPKISKNTLIKMELLDADYGNDHELVLESERPIDSFLRDGYISSDPFEVAVGSGWRVMTTKNFIDTIFFWQDEYDYTNENRRVRRPDLYLRVSNDWPK